MTSLIITWNYLTQSVGMYRNHGTSADVVCTLAKPGDDDDDDDE